MTGPEQRQDGNAELEFAAAVRLLRRGTPENGINLVPRWEEIIAAEHAMTASSPLNQVTSVPPLVLSSRIRLFAGCKSRRSLSLELAWEVSPLAGWERMDLLLPGLSSSWVTTSGTIRKNNETRCSQSCQQPPRLREMSS